MYIFVAKLPYERKIITCTDSVKLIVFVFSEKHFHEIQPRKIYVGTAVYCYAQSMGLMYSLQLIADFMSPKANTIPNIPVLYMQHCELKHDERSHIQFRKESSTQAMSLRPPCCCINSDARRLKKFQSNAKQILIDISFIQL